MPRHGANVSSVAKAKHSSFGIAATEINSEKFGIAAAEVNSENFGSGSGVKPPHPSKASGSGVKPPPPSKPLETSGVEPPQVSKVPETSGVEPPQVLETLTVKEELVMDIMDFEHDSDDIEIEELCKKALFPRRVEVGDYLCGLTKKNHAVYQGNTPCMVEYTLPSPYGTKVGPLAYQAVIGLTGRDWPSFACKKGAGIRS